MSFSICIKTKPPSSRRSLFAFAGIRTIFNGDRGTKSKPIPGPHEVYGFLTTAPNAVVEPIHPKAIRGRSVAAWEMPDRDWQRAFDDAIPIPGGRPLITLHDAATYATRLPRKEAEKPEWQAAVEALMLVAEGDGPTMFARIGLMKTLNRGRVREFNPSRKEPHWGRRKLARDR